MRIEISAVHLIQAIVRLVQEHLYQKYTSDNHNYKLLGEFQHRPFLKAAKLFPSFRNANMYPEEGVYDNRI